MPPFITPAFALHGRKPNQLREEDIVHLLSANGKVAFGSHGGSQGHSFTLARTGNALTLDSVIAHQGQNFKTEVRASRVQDDIFEITALIFDNSSEDLKGRQHIYNVLHHIGRKQLLATVAGGSAEPHREKGKFGKIGRFLARCAPDDPALWML